MAPLGLDVDHTGHVVVEGVRIEVSAAVLECQQSMRAD